MPLHVSAGKIKNLWRTDNDAVLHEIKNLWTDQGQVFSSGPTSEVYEVSLTDVRGDGAVHPLLTVTVPAGETWNVRIQGTITGSSGFSSSWPLLRIGTAESGPYGHGAAVDFSGTATSADSTIAIITRVSGTGNSVSFVGTVTIEK